MPGLSFAEHGVEDGEHFSHAGDERDFLWFAGREQLLVVGEDHGVVARGDEGGHVERPPHAGSAADDHAAATQRAAISIHGRDADERGELLTRGCS